MLKKYIKLLLVIFVLLCLNACDKKSSSVKYEHAFSVSKDKQVYIATSNIQYNPKLKQWRFASNAYDIIGLDNDLLSADYDGWIDLFAWGASGLSDIEPYCNDPDNTIYGNGHNDIADTDYDFALAVNKQMNSDWRMFSHDEIHYLLMYRENADKLFGYCLIDNVRGLYILPDDFVCPEGIDLVSAVDDGFKNNYDWYYSNGENDNYINNHLTIEQWKQIEEAGGVFLPAAGMRFESGCSHVGISGHYWTSSHYGEEFANCLCLFEHDLFLEGNFDRNTGLAVRLIKDAN